MSAKADPLTNQHDFGEVDTLPGPGILPLAGPTFETAAITRTVLQQNHVDYDIFFTEGGLHNHLAHGVLACYSLGAPAETVRAVYELSCLTQRPMLPVKHTINESNWRDFLGDNASYSSYLCFFAERVRTLGAAAAVERYIFHSADVDMLARTVSGALHPLIHIGYGVEFQLDAIVAEGLAQAAVHDSMVSPLFPSPWPEHSPPNALSSFTGRLSGSLRIGPKPNDSFYATARSLPRSAPRRPRAGMSGFSIVAAILADPSMAPGQVNSQQDGSKLGAAVKNVGPAIAAWCEEWVITENAPWEELVEKTEELFWLAIVMLFSSSRPGFKTRLDFFLMHNVTSVLFLPSLLEVLSPPNRIALLRSHFNVCIAYWISRGRPALHITELMSTSSMPTPPETPQFLPGGIARALEEARSEKRKESNGGAKVDDAEQDKADLEEPTTPRASATPSPAPPASPPSPTVTTHAVPTSVNPWTAIIASAQDHPDEHLTKLVRSLVYASTLFGTAAPGIFRCALKGSDLLDGSVFIRAAGIAMEVLGWAREGEDVSGNKWDYSALGFDEAWAEEAARKDKGKGRAVD